VKLTFCATCGSTDNLQYHHLVMCGEGGTASAQAAELNNRGMPTPRKKQWTARTVIDVLERIKANPA
jgi:hypothetical protein